MPLVSVPCTDLSNSSSKCSLLSSFTDIVSHELYADTQQESILITQIVMPFQAHEIYIIFQEIYILRTSFAAPCMIEYHLYFILKYCYAGLGLCCHLAMTTGSNEVFTQIENRRVSAINWFKQWQILILMLLHPILFAGISERLSMP